VFKSADEREAERRAREAEQARAAAARAEQARAAQEKRQRDAYLATPVGAATDAKEQGLVTGETSTDRVFVSGEATAISGVTMGVYLLRNTSLSDSVP
jgi:hypothetical protein